VQVAVGTFNLNNLFSRFDFRADVSTASASSVKVEGRTSFSFDDPSGFKLRTRGRRPSRQGAPRPVRGDQARAPEERQSARDSSGRRTQPRSRGADTPTTAARRGSPREGLAVVRRGQGYAPRGFESLLWGAKTPFTLLD
jgi:hypothetical protein